MPNLHTYLALVSYLSMSMLFRLVSEESIILLLSTYLVPTTVLYTYQVGGAVEAT